MAGADTRHPTPRRARRGARSRLSRSAAHALRVRAKWGFRRLPGATLGLATAVDAGYLPLPAASRPPRSGPSASHALRRPRGLPMIGRIEAIHERGEGSFVTDTTTLEATSGTSPRRSGALTAMRLAELQGLASSMGISGTAKMRKGDLVAAIKARQNGESGPASSAQPRRARREPDRASGASQATRTTQATQAPREERAPRAEQPALQERTEHHDDAPVRGERQERTDRQERADRQERTDGTRNDRADGNQHQNQNRTGPPAQGGFDDEDGRGGRRRRNRGRNRD